MFLRWKPDADAAIGPAPALHPACWSYPRYGPPASIWSGHRLCPDRVEGRTRQGPGGARSRVSRSASCGRATLLLRYLVSVHRFSVTIGGQAYSVRARGPRSALRKALGQYTEEPSRARGPLTATVQRKGGAPQTLSGVLSLKVSAHGKIEDWDFHW